MTNLEFEKINKLLEQKFNSFHADLITRAIKDKKLSLRDFQDGCYDITDAERNGEDDEYIPDGWGKVL